VDFGPEEEFVAEQRRLPRWRRLMDQLEAGRATLKNFFVYPMGDYAYKTLKTASSIVACASDVPFGNES
jgi:hypothetical protein